jgi:3-isopropylmalate/(R)-2-methylmalate dehydratase small subunit
MQEKKESPLENFFGESSEASEAIREGDRVRVNLTTGEIFNLTQKKKFFAKPIPTFMQELIRDGGLIRHLRKKGLKGKR